jgi:hypothetical protein
MTMSRQRIGLLLTLGALLVPIAAGATANIVIVNTNAPGVGFNDPNPATEPAPGNPGTTLGQQRLNAFQHAADIWGAVLDSTQTIYIQASFVPLTPCTASSGVLGSAGTISIVGGFDGAEYPNDWYHQALGNKLSGVDQVPGPNNTAADDIRARFNSNLGVGTCLTGLGWYYGLDANQPANRINLVTVLLHEFGHGLGFSTFTNGLTGTRPLGFGDVFAEYILDVSTGKHWNSMTSAELVASGVNSRHVVWDGITVNAEAPGILAPGTPLLTVNSPAVIAGAYEVGAAAFGPPLSSPGITGNIVQALDAANAAGPTTFDACSPISNGASVAGNIALVDRGTCGFTVKVKNAQDAGAIAVVVADNAAGGPPAGLGGADPTITIPAVRITLADGNKIKAQLAGGVNGTLGVDLSVLAGTEASTGFVHLNAPNPFQSGSSISHWDPVTFPNQLMEPAINSDLTHNLSEVDLTRAQMVDVGWFSDFDGVPDGRDVCLGSDQGPTIVIAGCDSGADNVTFIDGCRISDYLKQCANGAGNHGAYVSCVAHATDVFKSAGFMNGQGKGGVQSCAAGAAIP